MTDFLDAKRKEIADRMKELKPAVEEYDRLKAATAALAKVDSATPAAATTTNNAPPRRRPGRPRRSVISASKATPVSAPAASTPAKLHAKNQVAPKDAKKQAVPP